MSRGAIFAVVGPSGAGKDTLLRACIALRPDLCLVRRVITRPEAAGGEDFDGVTAEEFEARKANGAFALTWDAHGLRYGIPVSVRRQLDEGRTLLFNGSRHALAEAHAAFPTLRVIVVTAPPEVLATRLAARGRESAADIMARLSRAPYTRPDKFCFETIINDRSVDDGAQALLRAIQPESALR